MYIPRFFYNDGATEGGGADGNKDQQQQNNNDANANGGEGKGEGDKGGEGNEGKKDTPAAPIAMFSPDELKELGVDNEADAKKLLLSLSAKEKERNVPDAEKEKKLNLEKADFLKYAADNNSLKVEDYNKLEALKSTPDRELVFQNFLTAFKEENPHLEKSDLERLAKEEFESEYKLDSANEKTKARGLTKIGKEAAELRSPLQQKYDEAFGKYSDHKEVASKIPAFNAFIDEVIKEATPDKLTVLKLKEGDDELPVELELTKEQREEISKLFRTPKAFQAYNAKGAKADEVKAAIAKKIEGFIKINNFEKAITKSFEMGKGVGTAQGSKAGAENTFGKTQQSDKKPAKVVTIQESNEKIANARQQYQAGR